MPPKGRLPATRAAAPASGASARNERRILLPSNRVAVFRVPNVGEFLDMRAEAIRIVAARGESSDASVGVELGKMVLRRHLVGLTGEPVQSVYKAGFDAAALRAKLEAEGLADDVLETAIAAAEDAAEDVEATKASARPAPVNDLVWDEAEGAVGEYLAAMPTSMLDEPEGRDWQSLNDYAQLVMPQVMRGLNAPKAGRPRIRSLR